MTSLEHVRLALFFTRGASLTTWQQAGILDRELLPYRRLARDVGAVTILSYGGEQDRLFEQQASPVGVLVNRWRLPATLYSVMAPLLHARQLRAATVFKTTQLNGAWTAAAAKRLYGKRLIVRCGYLWSAFLDEAGAGAGKRYLARALEQWVLRAADRIVVATEPDAGEIVARYGIDPTRIRVIPNYVDVARFRPLPLVRKQPRLVMSVGRLHEQKNFDVLLDAVDGIADTQLALIGEGPLRPALEEQARARQLPVEFMGTVAHEQLPEVLNQAAVFVLPSKYEGHPKALLEAMACGLPVIGTKVPGIRDLLVHRETGYLCGTSAADIRAAIVDVLGDEALARDMSRQARAYVQDHCSLDAVLESERALLRELHA